MEYHYSGLCMPTDHLLNGSYTTEYSTQYLAANVDAEYKVCGSVLVNGGQGVSAVVFDKFEELIWMGSQGGLVTSYYGPMMQKYTSFKIHETEEVRDIITVDQGIYALTKTTLRHQIRRGIPKHTFRSENMTDMQCLFQVHASKLLIGGHQDKLLDLDLNRMMETIIPIQEEGCAVLRSGGGSLVACGSASGSVALRDIRSPSRAEHTFRAHSACLSDLDMQGDLLITCGFTHSDSVAVAEPYVVVWDVRYLRGTKVRSEAASTWTINTASPPLLLHFLPAFSGRAVALSGDGHVALLHVNSGNNEQSVFQVDVQSSVCSVMDVAATSQALVFGDRSGHLHLFSPQHNNEPVFNNFSRETVFAQPVEGLPFVSLNDTTFRFSSIPLGPLNSGDKWFNELPPEFFKKQYRKPRPIDPEILKTMKMQGPIGYAPNPKKYRRNQMPYIEDKLEDLKAAKQNENKFNTQPVPRHYQKMDIRYNKHSQNEQELNRTGLPGLEATIPNSYCNSMLQVLYHTPPVKAILLAHTCAKEFCLSCELGFLFRMLDKSSGKPCQATNFLRAFRTAPEAAALGLILPDRGPEPRVDLVALIQSWNRFILHQIHYELLETRRKEKELSSLATGGLNGNLTRTPNGSKAPEMNGQYAEEYQYAELEFLGPSTEFDPDETLKKDGWNGNSHNEAVIDGDYAQNSLSETTLTPSHSHTREESDISRLFAIGRHQLNRCLKCNKEEERESAVLACALQYGGARDGASAGGGFAELLRTSLTARRSTPAWCERCARFAPTAQRTALLRLPPILAVNCGGVSANEKAYWCKGTQKDMVGHCFSSPSLCRGYSTCTHEAFRFIIYHADGKGVELSSGVCVPRFVQFRSLQGKSEQALFEFACYILGSIITYHQTDPKRGSSNKPCRYGLHCARPGCRFKHPDRPSPTQGNSSRSPSAESQCALPLQLIIRLQSDGDVIITDKSDQSQMESPSKDPLKNKKKPLTTQSEEVYSLAAAVVCVEDNPKNLVAYVQLPDREETWYMVNDLCIVPVTPEEVVQFAAWWKTPCVLFYASERARLAPDPLARS